MTENKYQTISSPHGRLDLKENAVFQLGPLVDRLKVREYRKKEQNLPESSSCRRRKHELLWLYLGRGGGREARKRFQKGKIECKQEDDYKSYRMKGTVVEVWHLKRIFMMSSLLHCYMKTSFKYQSSIKVLGVRCMLFLYVFMCFPLSVCFGAGYYVKSVKLDPWEAQLLLG